MYPNLFGATIIVALAAASIPSISKGDPAACEAAAKRTRAYNDYVNYTSHIPNIYKIVADDSQKQASVALEVAGKLRQNSSSHKMMEQLVQEQEAAIQPYKQNFQNALTVLRISSDKNTINAEQALLQSIYNREEADLTEYAVPQTQLRTLAGAVKSALPSEMKRFSTSVYPGYGEIHFGDSLQIEPLVSGHVTTSQENGNVSSDADLYVGVGADNRPTVILELCDSIRIEPKDSPYSKNCARVDALTGRLLQSPVSLNASAGDVIPLEDWIQVVAQNKILPEYNHSPYSELSKICGNDNQGTPAQGLLQRGAQR